MQEYDWHPHYLAAVYEPDQEVFREKLDHAEIVLLKRSGEILPDKNPEEFEALTRTIQTIRIIRSARLHGSLHS